MNAVFLDTVGLLALWDVADQWHAPAEEAFADLVASKIPLVTSSFVLLECGNAAARKPYRDVVVELRKTLLAREELFEPSPDEIEAAWIAYENKEADRAGIIDQTSFAIMRRLSIRKAFTNDQHFESAGFEISF
jgi:predicted nucleic acid-binding protein